MASIRKEILINAHAADVWAAVRDVGAVHQRLAEGFVVDTRLDGSARTVTFANGLVLRELIVDVDDEARRLVYAAVGGRATQDRKSTRLNSSHITISYAVFCLKKKKKHNHYDLNQINEALTILSRRSQSNHPLRACHGRTTYTCAGLYSITSR